MVVFAQKSAILLKRSNLAIRLPNSKEKIMHLYLAETMRSLGKDEQTFFRAAYMWRFGKDYDCVNDVCQYRLHALIPKYVVEYVDNIQKEEARCSAHNVSEK